MSHHTTSYPIVPCHTPSHHIIARQAKITDGLRNLLGRRYYLGDSRVHRSLYAQMDLKAQACPSYTTPRPPFQCCGTWGLRAAMLTWVFFFLLTAE